MTKQFLCKISDIEENQAIGLNVHQKTIFIVRRDNQYYAYINSCPHTGVNLNWQENQFMDIENYYIQCSIHGALFNVEDGRCVWGPCVNQSLSSVPILVEKDAIYALP